jgi:hypothetical protein
MNAQNLDDQIQKAAGGAVGAADDAEALGSSVVAAAETTALRGGSGADNGAARQHGPTDVVERNEPPYGRVAQLINVFNWFE